MDAENPPPPLTKEYRTSAMPGPLVVVQRTTSPTAIAVMLPGARRLAQVLKWT